MSESGVPKERVNTAGAELVSIPKWFVWFASTMMALSLPWFAWATVTLVTIQVRMDYTENWHGRLKSIESDLQGRLRHPDIHHGKLRELTIRIEALEKKFNE